jgi:hypothetical protein
MTYLQLPKQPSRIYSYLDVGRLLYWSLILFVLESVFYWNGFKEAYTYSNNLWLILGWLWCLLFSFSHIFLVIMDGWSRFQNYKRIKDHLFQHGFTPQGAWHYKGSKCQRRAALVAAKELGMHDDMKKYFDRIGVRWYHFIPYFMVEDPFFLFRKYFWSRTFMEKQYTSKFDYGQPVFKLPYNA